MKSLLPAAIIAIAITGYFAWNSYNVPAARAAFLDQCHRLAGAVQATHEKGGTVSGTMLEEARGCSTSFGQNWAVDPGERAAQLRAEGAMRIQ